MKYIFTCIFIFISSIVFAQINTDLVYGSWVKSKVTFEDGSELPDDSPLKYSFVKYIFSKPDKFNISLIYYINGKTQSFEIVQNKLIIKSNSGATLNSFLIASAKKDTLILLQPWSNETNDRRYIKNYLIPEAGYQNSIPVKSSDILSVTGGDTTYKMSRKFYAQYKGESFYQYMREGIKDDQNTSDRKVYFKISFIVSKNGVADDLNILEGADDELNKGFIKVFNKAKRDWKPAMLNGKPVNVQMTMQL